MFGFLVGAKPSRNHALMHSPNDDSDGAAEDKFVRVVMEDVTCVDG